ncbi:tail fiber assembly protein [Morganella morganii]|uniref:tail fiber assembly protein n=1 Tax=Morganella morganii TaxID=582 RepID=UPI0013CD5D42|nr:tail fiber assembly protein [Morganella morganii]HDT0714045.1 tail fiber assembly protein [Morganella morganii subsp. morganii]NGE94945.1 tail fiber assembly protein [Morganella morganii]HCD1110735.1 tail fiber assembly protein [Morganella morganii]HCT2376403.1 tail fiber assembly protein [Morganella morganii]HCT9735583.1 tail fiber assembly protein [Morganella morganii]
MRYYKTKNNEIYALEDNDSAKEWIKEKVTEITKEEADNITNPRPTKEQLIAKAEYDKQALITEVQAETQLLQTKLALGRITPDEKARLNAWLDYLDELEAVDVSTAPDIIWPKKL